MGMTRARGAENPSHSVRQDLQPRTPARLAQPPTRTQHAWTASSAHGDPKWCSVAPTRTTASSNNVAGGACNVKGVMAPCPVLGNKGLREQDKNDVYILDLDDSAMQQEFMLAASQLSENELREFVLDHIHLELKSIRALPSEQRGHAFRMLLVEWHPDKCPAITGLATEMFQVLQEQKDR